MTFPIDFSDNGAFDPIATEAMGKAFELGCIALKGRPLDERERLARLIIEAAKDGLRDPVQLSVKAVNNITAPN